MNPLDLPAIALIDEVDLHLHPSWQQHILTDLMQTFRNTQFIVTTHSAQVLSTVKRENIRVIGPDSSGKIVVAPPLAMTYGEPSGDVLQSVMLVDPQPPVAEKADLQRLTELVDQGRYHDQKAIDLLQALTVALGPQHPQLLRLLRSIQRQEALKK
jgi:predicted ATP-binding protein involved in virulence